METKQLTQEICNILLSKKARDIVKIYVAEKTEL